MSATKAAVPLILLEMRVLPRTFVFRFASSMHFADFFRAHYGPTVKAFEALGERDGKLLYDDLLDLAARWNVAIDGTTKIPADYVQMLAVRR